LVSSLEFVRPLYYPLCYPPARVLVVDPALRRGSDVLRLVFRAALPVDLAATPERLPCAALTFPLGAFLAIVLSFQCCSQICDKFVVKVVIALFRKVLSNINEDIHKEFTSE